MDIITHLPVTERGCDAIATFVDRMSKYVYFVPCKSTTSAEEVAYSLQRWCHGTVCLSILYLTAMAGSLVGFGSR